MNNLEEQLKLHVYTLSDRIGERNLGHYKELLRARDYVADAFANYGLTPSIQEYTVWNSTFHNVVAHLPGSDPKADVIVVGAHYDSAEGTPGADDNASGTAGLLELARLLKGAGLRKSVTFVAFGTEEPPYFGTDLMGSRFYSKQAVAKGDRISAMICLETIGYFRKEKGSQSYPTFLLKPFFPDTGVFISIVGNFRSRALVRQVRDGMKRHAALPIEHAALPAFLPGVDWSDHRSFWAEGIPAVMLTDTALYRNHNYHQHTDTYDTLDYKSMAQVILGLSETIKEMAR